VVNRCVDCGVDNQSSMHFCVHCGVALRRIFSTLCLKCHNNDELNGPYCIICGACCDSLPTADQDIDHHSIPSVQIIDRVLPKHSSFSWVRQITSHKEVLLVVLCLSIAIGYSLIFVSKLFEIGNGTPVHRHTIDNSFKLPPQVEHK
jgi:hypothetical protein